MPDSQRRILRAMTIGAIGSARPRQKAVVKAGFFAEIIAVRETRLDDLSTPAEERAVVRKAAKVSRRRRA